MEIITGEIKTRLLPPATLRPEKVFLDFGLILDGILIVKNKQNLFVPLY
jgi:hypothetical protein